MERDHRRCQNRIEVKFHQFHLNVDQTVVNFIDTFVLSHQVKGLQTYLRGHLLAQVIYFYEHFREFAFQEVGRHVRSHREVDGLINAWSMGQEHFSVRRVTNVNCIGMGEQF